MWKGSKGFKGGAKGGAKGGGFGVQQPFLKQAAATPHNFKTSMCKFFEQGTCTKGDSCTFSHGEQAALPHNYKTNMCKFFEQGTCTKGDSCTFSHGEQGGIVLPAQQFSQGGSTPCKFFQQGLCNKGDACTFSHGGGAPARGGFGGFAKGGAAPAWGAKGGGKALAPAWGAKGGGKGMDSMQGGSTPCKFFAMGTCAKGAQCTFSHGGGGGGGGFGGGFAKGGAKGSLFGKGKGKDGKSKNKGKGHLLPRTRISEAPFSGTVVEWKGKFGWIMCAEPIEHEKAMKHEGKLFVGKDDLNGLESLEPGATVEFHIWEDASGLGADEVNVF